MHDRDADAPEDQIADEVTDAAKAVQAIGKINVVSLLFGPSAKIIGEHWAKKLENRLTAEETENVEAHLDAVKNKLPPPDDVEYSPTLAGALLEWTDAVKSIDPQPGSVVSEAWRSALVQAFEGNLELLKVLPLLDEPVLALLRNGGYADAKSEDVLTKNGLSTARTKPTFISHILLFFALVLVMVIFFTFLEDIKSFLKSIEELVILYISSELFAKGVRVSILLILLLAIPASIYVLINEFYLRFFDRRRNIFGYRYLDLTIRGKYIQSLVSERDDKQGEIIVQRHRALWIR